MDDSGRTRLRVRGRVIHLAWLLAWLSIYTPQYTPPTYEIRVAPIPGYVGAYAYYAQGYVVVDMDKINRLPGAGPWDKVVVGACVLAHEDVHMRRRDANELPAYLASVQCVDRFTKAVGYTPYTAWVRAHWQRMYEDEYSRQYPQGYTGE